MVNSNEEKRINENATEIRLLSKDVSYIKDIVVKLESTFSILDKIYAKKDDLKSLEKRIDDTHRDIKTELAKKVDSKEFTEVKNTLTKINWLIISMVVIALLNLIIKST